MPHTTHHTPHTYIIYLIQRFSDFTNAMRWGTNMKQNMILGVPAFENGNCIYVVRSVVTHTCKCVFGCTYTGYGCKRPTEFKCSPFATTHFMYVSVYNCRGYTSHHFQNRNTMWLYTYSINVNYNLRSTIFHSCISPANMIALCTRQSCWVLKLISI